MKQYLDLLENILTHGVEKESGRENMPNTIGISHAMIEMDLAAGFPLLTTKKMYWQGIVHELLWFLRGDTNIKYLVDNNVNIWNEDAYSWYLRQMKDRKMKPYITDFKSFVSIIKHTNKRYLHIEPGYSLGDLGKGYGHQWRKQNGTDQVKEVLTSLKENPYSRYHIIDSWNKADFPEMALPPCHLLYQFIVRPNKIDGRFFLDLNMYQRSSDVFLGVPFNLASMSLLLMLFSKVSKMTPGVVRWISGDTHLYAEHIPQAQEQLLRSPRKLPELIIHKELNSLDDILSLTIDDFELADYQSHPAIKAKLFTGLTKS